jgi:hypothetical protein
MGKLLEWLRRAWHRLFPPRLWGELPAELPKPASLPAQRERVGMARRASTGHLSGSCVEDVMSVCAARSVGAS